MKPFKFENKAKILESLLGRLKHAEILPLIHFSVVDWEKNRQSILKIITRDFDHQNLIIRSSSIREDQNKYSMAGAFTSLLNIQNIKAKVEAGINSVIASYGESLEAKDDRVLIQPFLSKVSIAGVMCSINPSNGAPYFTIDYEETGATDGITSGRSSKRLGFFYLGR